MVTKSDLITCIISIWLIEGLVGSVQLELMWILYFVVDRKWGPFPTATMIQFWPVTGGGVIQATEGKKINLFHVVATVFHTGRPKVASYYILLF